MPVPPVPIRSLALATSLIASIPVAMANQCGDISPLLSTLGEDYYDLDNKVSSSLFDQTIEPNDLIHTLKSERFRQGEGQRTQCFGTSTLTNRVRDMELQFIEPARINSANEIVLKAYEYDAERKTSHRATVFIPLSTQSLSLVGNDGLIVNTRHRQPVRRMINIGTNDSTNDNIGTNDNPNDTIGIGIEGGGAHLREISMTVNGDNNRIEINQLIYVNGHLAEWFTWHLDS